MKVLAAHAEGRRVDPARRDRAERRARHRGRAPRARHGAGGGEAADGRRRVARRVPPPQSVPPGGVTSARDVACAVLVRVEDGAYSNLVLPEALRRTGLDGARPCVRHRPRLRDAARPAPPRRPTRAAHPPAPRRARPAGAGRPAPRRVPARAGVAPHAAVGETVEAAPDASARLRERGAARRRRGRAALAGGGQRTGGAVLPRLGPGPAHRRPRRRAGPRGARRAERGAPLTLRAQPVRASPPPRSPRSSPTRSRPVAGPSRPTPSRSGARATRGACRRSPRGAPPRRTRPAKPSSRSTDPQPDDRVLDVGAAPGGKATGLAERVSDGVVVALDVHPGRLAPRRHRGPSARPRHRPPGPRGRARPTGGAAERGPGARRRALLGARRAAPPTGGPLARSRSPPRRCVALQVALVLAAAATLRPGGRLVYSVCTLTRAETTGVADTVLAPSTASGSSTRPGRRGAVGTGALLLPQEAGTDGMFVLTLERR